MGHKLGAAFHILHGLANALLIANVIRYNANDNPTKQAAFSQYDRPKAKCRYAEIARHLDLGGANADEQVESLVQWIEGLKRDLDVPPSIREAGVSEADFLAGLDAKAVVAIGSCPASCNVFAGSPVVKGPLNRHIPVDVYVPGCPPHPDAIINGIARAVVILAERGVRQQGKGEMQK
jgi:hypothetical protein